MGKTKLIAISAAAILAWMPVVAFGASYFFVDDSGNIGVGNSTPASRLDVSGTIYSRMVTDTDSSNVTVDWNEGNVHEITLNTSNTTFSFSNGQAGGEYTMLVNQDATGGRTVSWPASVKWMGGAPTLTTAASSTDLIHFVYNGSKYIGTYALNGTPPPPQINGSVVNGGGSTASPSVSVTVGSGLTDSILVAIVKANVGSPSTANITGCTYNGNAMTEGIVQVGSVAVYKVYYMMSPSSGTHNVSCTLDTAHVTDIVAFTVTGADQSSFPDSSAGAGLSGSATNASQMLTTSADNALVIDYSTGSGTQSLSSFGVGQNQIINFTPSAGGDSVFGSSIVKAAHGSITTSQTWGGAVGSSNAYGNFSIAPAH